MSDALEKPVSLFFSTPKEARAFRTECYRQRSALRLVGMKDFDCLRFKLIQNVVTIINKRGIRNKL